MENNQENEHEIMIRERIVSIETKMNTVLENHLPHIQTAIHELKDQIKELGDRISGHPTWSVALIITGLASVVALLVPIVLQNGG